MTRSDGEDACLQLQQSERPWQQHKAWSSWLLACSHPANRNILKQRCNYVHFELPCKALGFPHLYCRVLGLFEHWTLLGGVVLTANSAGSSHLQRPSPVHTSQKGIQVLDMGGRGKGRSQVNTPSAWSVQFAHPLPHPLPFLSVKEEDSHCRAEPLQAEIVDQQALSQQVSSYPSSQGRVVTTRYFPHFRQLSQVLLRDTIFSQL